VVKKTEETLTTEDTEDRREDLKPQLPTEQREEERMSRDQMRNLETFKIGSSQVNEFEYQKNRGQMTEQLEQHADEAAKGAKRPTQAERVKQIMAAAHQKVEKKRKKEAAKAGKSRAAVSRDTGVGSDGAAKKRAPGAAGATKATKKR
jgi:hypothetical protein